MIYHGSYLTLKNYCRNLLKRKENERWSLSVLRKGKIVFNDEFLVFSCNITVNND